MNLIEAPIWQRYRKLPRATQWALAAGIAVVVFLIYDSIVGPLTGSWNEQADEMLADVATATGGGQRARQVSGLREPILALGVVSMPGTESDANQALHAIVNDVLKRHPVSRDSFNYHGAAKLPRGTLRDVLASGQSLERISGDLRFDAEPEEAMSIIAELEDSPNIESISSVRMTRQAGPQKVTVDLTVDAWIVSADTRARGLGAP